MRIIDALCPKDIKVELLHQLNITEFFIHNNVIIKDHENKSLISLVDQICKEHNNLAIIAHLEHGIIIVWHMYVPENYKSGSSHDINNEHFFVSRSLTIKDMKIQESSWWQLEEARIIEDKIMPKMGISKSHFSDLASPAYYQQMTRQYQGRVK